MLSLLVLKFHGTTDHGVIEMNKNEWQFATSKFIDE